MLKRILKNGYIGNMTKRTGFVIYLLILTATLSLFIPGSYSSAKNLTAKKQAETVNKEQSTAAEKLSLINSYQEKYFQIIKRNDVLLNYEDDKTLNKDRKELKKLFSEVKKQIKNKDYLKKHKEIAKRYSKCDELTTTGMNEFEQKYYNEVDALLNTVYKEVQSKISSADFKNLTLSEKKWLKDVEAYKKVFDSKGFGSIGTIIYYDYEINMREFRTLLLMLYL